MLRTEHYLTYNYLTYHGFGLRLSDQVEQHIIIAESALGCYPNDLECGSGIGKGGANAAR